jgi:Co/Zn/Cd efflux system component
MCDDDVDVPKATSGYRRALILVVILNLGTGLTEMTAGLFGLSQALKADALDFLGDGLITLLGLVAVSRGPRWRARAAFLQGIFLALLAAGIILAAVYRAIEQELPSAATMAGFGLIGLLANVGSALVLIPHRHGDANVRAVWLFSRNDALGNVAVIIASGLVVWLKSAWPDIVTAIVIASLFLHSSLEILKTARRELRGDSA